MNFWFVLCMNIWPLDEYFSFPFRSFSAWRFGLRMNMFPSLSGRSWGEHLASRIIFSFPFGSFLRKTFVPSMNIPPSLLGRSCHEHLASRWIYVPILLGRPGMNICPLDEYISPSLSSRSQHQHLSPRSIPFRDDFFVPLFCSWHEHFSARWIFCFPFLGGSWHDHLTTQCILFFPCRVVPNLNILLADEPFVS